METTNYLLQRARQGDADAAFRLGHRFAFGRGRGRAEDWRKAVEYWKVAAKDNHPRAEFYLGTCYEWGEGVGKNLKAAIAWYRKAASHGSTAAQYNLAFSYREGNGVPKSMRTAIAYYQLAAKH